MVVSGWVVVTTEVVVDGGEWLGGCEREWMKE
jgi:hypothetical protein